MMFDPGQLPEWGSVALQIAVSTASAGGLVYYAIKTRIQAHYDKELEALKGTLRESEERSKVLMSGALEGEKFRAEILSRRRIEALEAIWKDVFAKRSFEPAAQALQNLNLQEIQKLEKQDEIEKMKIWISTLMKFTPTKQKWGDGICVERLYVGSNIWKLYRAYFRVVSLSSVILNGLSVAGPEILRFLKFDEAEDEVVLAVPYMEKFIREHPKSGIFFMYEQLREELFAAIAKQLGEQTDEEDLNRVRRKVEMVLAPASLPPEVPAPPIEGIVREREEPSLPS